MKKLLKWKYSILFFILSAGVIWFLHLFTVESDTMQFVEWDSAVRLEADGTETPCEWDSYSNESTVTGTYRFIGTLPETASAGTLLFETSGMSLTLNLGGTELYRSYVLLTDVSSDAPVMSQATVPISEGTGQEVVMTCEILSSDHLFFPPLVRFLPDGFQDEQAYALANRTALPTGAAALALILSFGLFLLGIMLKKTDWSLIPLILAAVGLVVYRITVDEGYYFLTPSAAAILGRSEIALLTALALIVYLLMNRKRRFWRYFGIALAGSASILVVCYMISSTANSYLSSYLNTEVRSLFLYGSYDGLLYWFSLWLTIVAMAISACGTVRTYVDQQTHTQQLALQNQLVRDNYRILEDKMRETASIQHRQRHDLTTLDCLCQQGDYTGIKKLLDQLIKRNEEQIQTIFTDNITINTILVDAADRAAGSSIDFQAQVHVPEKICIPEQDLCSLLMNMLDNALEASRKVAPPRKRFISISIKVIHNHLAIRCENSCTGEFKTDKQGKLLTTRKDTISHGFGLEQMGTIAEKYHSLLDISHTEEGNFIVQTALKIPDD